MSLRKCLLLIIVLVELVLSSYGQINTNSIVLGYYYSSWYRKSYEIYKQGSFIHIDIESNNSSYPYISIKDTGYLSFLAGIEACRIYYRRYDSIAKANNIKEYSKSLDIELHFTVGWTVGDFLLGNYAGIFHCYNGSYRPLFNIHNGKSTITIRDNISSSDDKSKRMSFSIIFSSLDEIDNFLKIIGKNNVDAKQKIIEEKKRKAQEIDNLFK